MFSSERKRSNKHTQNVRVFEVLHQKTFREERFHQLRVQVCAYKNEWNADSSHTTRNKWRNGDREVCFRAFRLSLTLVLTFESFDGNFLVGQVPIVIAESRLFCKFSFVDTAVLT